MGLTREQIAQRIAKEMKDGYYVNLGIGIPTLVANYIPFGMQVMVCWEWESFPLSKI
jgi:3-oxoacid CoA-transferase subunit B